MTQPGSPMQIDYQTVFDVLAEEPLSRALLERAQFLVALRAQATELQRLRAAQDEKSGGS